jgi:hypothetical protein
LIFGRVLQSVAEEDELIYDALEQRQIPAAAPHALDLRFGDLAEDAHSSGRRLKAISLQPRLTSSL